MLGWPSGRLKDNRRWLNIASDITSMRPDEDRKTVPSALGEPPQRLPKEEVVDVCPLAVSLPMRS
eukprot:443826-Pyramimonas_sp.AAC.1